MLRDCTHVHRGLLGSIGPRLPDGRSEYRVPLCLRRVNSARPEAGIDRKARDRDGSGDHLHEPGRRSGACLPGVSKR